MKTKDYVQKSYYFGSSWYGNMEEGPVRYLSSNIPIKNFFANFLQTTTKFNKIFELKMYKL